MPPMSLLVAISAVALAGSPKTPTDAPFCRCCQVRPWCCPPSVRGRRHVGPNGREGRAGRAPWLVGAPVRGNAAVVAVMSKASVVLES